MKVQSFDNQSFQARKDRNYGAYNPRKNPRANVDAIISLDDNAVKQIAYAKTLASVEDDKHRKITKAMFWSIPAVAGLATAILNPAKASLLGKELTGVAARLSNGAKSGAAWGVLLGLVSALNGSLEYAEKKSPSVRKFTRENPITTFIGQMAAFIGAVALGGKYLPKAADALAKHIKPSTINKAADALAKHIKPSTINKAADKIAKGADKLNNAKFTKTAVKYANKIADSKWFDPLKGFSKTALSWAPSVLLWGGVLHSINHNNVKEREFVKNYSEIKDFQSQLAKARIMELSNSQLAPKMNAHQA